MSDQSPPSSPGAGRRRSSFTDMFVSRPSAAPPHLPLSQSPPNTNLSTPMSGTQSNRRGMSITTLGLSGSSPSQTSPLSAFAKQRRASVASSSASGSPEFKNSFEDSAVIEEDNNTGVPVNTPATPSFARRVSFGAQALRDVRSTGTAPAGRRPSLFATLQEQPENESPGNKSPPSTPKATTIGGSRAEGLNWSEALRDRTKRQPSMSTSGNPFQHRARAASVATMEPPKEMPKPQSPPMAARVGKPDQLGERMLRGDFMMD